MVGWDNRVNKQKKQVFLQWTTRGAMSPCAWRARMLTRFRWPLGMRQDHNQKMQQNQGFNPPRRPVSPTSTKFAGDPSDMTEITE